MEWLSGISPPAMKQPKDRTTFNGIRSSNSVPMKTSIFPSMQQNTNSKAKLFPSFSSAPDVFSKVNSIKFNILHHTKVNIIM